MSNEQQVTGDFTGLADNFLVKIGNVDDMKDQLGEKYRYIRRSIEPAGIFKHPDIALKVYRLIREETPPVPGSRESLDGFLLSELKRKGIKLRQRIGFVILGQAFVGIYVWGKGNGLFLQCYASEPGDDTLRRRPLEETAIACTWDSRVVNFECRLWHKFLLSDRSVYEKRRYLNTFISGDLEDENVCAVPSEFHVSPSRQGYR